MEYVLLWIVCGFFAATVASSKGRGFGGWFFLGLLFGPIALIAIGFMPKEENVQGLEQAEAMQSERKCPFCAETIKSEAIVCKHCGRDVEPIVINDIDMKKEFCPHCGNETDDATSNCSYCGREIHSKYTDIYTLHCRYCGKLVGSDHSKCQHCKQNTGY